MTIRNVRGLPLPPPQCWGWAWGGHLCTVTAGCGLPFNNLIHSEGFHAEISLGNTATRSLDTCLDKFIC